MTKETGPGHTRWLVRDDNLVVSRDGYAMYVEEAHASYFPMTAEDVARRMNEAYKIGRLDQARKIRRALGVIT